MAPTDAEKNQSKFKPEEKPNQWKPVAEILPTFQEIVVAMEDKSVLELWTTFCAIATVYGQDPNTELKNWLETVGSLELWGAERSHAIKVLEWKNLIENVDKKEEQIWPAY